MFLVNENITSLYMQLQVMCIWCYIPYTRTCTLHVHIMITNAIPPVLVKYYLLIHTSLPPQSLYTQTSMPYTKTCTFYAHIVVIIRSNQYHYTTSYLYTTQLPYKHVVILQK